jgi:leader peptidase (prepilin peptidase)/N-methyltransferase
VERPVQGRFTPGPCGEVEASPLSQPALSIVLALGLGLAGAAVGAGVRWTSVRLARAEELEQVPERRWQVFGPPVVTALLFVVFALKGPLSVELAARLVFVTVLVQVVFFDLEHHLILDRVVYPAIALALLLSLLGSPWWGGIVAGIALGLGFLAFGLVGSFVYKQEAVGLGDVKLAVLIGLLLGPVPAVVAVLLGIGFAGLVATTIAIWRRSMQGNIALGPFLAAGALVALYRLA